MFFEKHFIFKNYIKMYILHATKQSHESHCHSLLPSTKFVKGVARLMPLLP
jgi:hypothetical protein